MQSKNSIIFGILVISLIIINGCGETKIVKETQYVCPDGSFVSDASLCPEPDIFENVLFNPPEVKIYLQAGEVKDETIEVINNNKETLFLDCYTSGKDNDFEPFSTCYTFDDNGFYTKTAKINPGERHSFVIKVTTDKNVDFSNAEGERFILTTRSGEYSKKIKFSVLENSVPRKTKEISLSIVIT